MSGDDFKRLARAVFFLFITLMIVFLGMLPGDFSKDGLQISPYLFSWTAAFIIRRPGSSGVFVILLAAFQYAIYNDEGIALGSLAYLAFALLCHEVREYLEHQSFVLEVLALTSLYFVIQLLKNFLLQLFFTQGFELFTIFKFSLYFAISYVLFSLLINLILGRRTSKQISYS